LSDLPPDVDAFGRTEVIVGLPGSNTTRRLADLADTRKAFRWSERFKIEKTAAGNPKVLFCGVPLL
jgi:hypothetical protein